MNTFDSQTGNPAGSPRLRASVTPAPPAPDVADKQDPAHTEEDFLRDLDRATTNRSKERLGRG
jgi:hypothetical protein